MSDDSLWFRPPPRPSHPPQAPASPESPAVDVVIDGRPARVPATWTILEACRSLGIDTPTLCYLENLTPVNVCRVCVVELAGDRESIGIEFAYGVELRPVAVVSLDAREIAFGQRRGGDPPTGQRLDDIAHGRVRERRRGLRLGANGSRGAAGIAAGWLLHGVPPDGPPEGHAGFLAVSADARSLIVAQDHAHTFATMANIEKCGQRLVAVSHSLTVLSPPEVRGPGRTRAQ